MENKQKISRWNIILLIGIFFLIILFGVSYAIFYYNFKGNQSAINVEPIELEFLESTSEIISIDNVLPMSDSEGIIQDETFNFAVTTRTESEQNVGYSLEIEKLSVDSGYTLFSDDQVKIFLTNYNDYQLVPPTKVSDLNNYILYGKINSHNSTTTEVQDKYKLRVWIDEEVDASTWQIDTKFQYKFKINVAPG